MTIIKYIIAGIVLIALSVFGCICSMKFKRNMWEDYNNSDDDYETYQRREQWKNRMD